MKFTISNFLKTSMFLFPVFGFFISLVLKVNYLTSTLLFFVPLSLTLSFHKPTSLIRAALFSIIGGFPLLVIIDHFAYLHSVWYINKSILPFRLLDGSMPIEDLIWVFLFGFLSIMIYDNFFNKSERVAIDKKMGWLLIGSVIVILFLRLFSIITPRVTPYAYTWFIIPIVIPLILFFIKYPNLFGKFLIPSSYMSVILFLFEIVGISLDHWSFPGKYIGFISLSQIIFPIEEFIFIILLGPMFTLVLYEYFDDDKK